MKKIYKEELVKLTHQKNIEDVRLFLEYLPSKDKGKAFEWYLAELYKGNGWLIQMRGGSADSGADILLYHPKTPSIVSLIVQTKNHIRPLTFDQTKIELMKFEEQAAPRFNCQQFCIVSINGFVGDAERLSQFNMLLYNWEYVSHLIRKYDPENIAEPEIELYAHNKKTYEKCKEIWQESNYVSVVQPTGTGKSYLIAKHLADFQDRNSLVMAPSNYILAQQRSKVPWATHSTTFMTYSKGANLTDQEVDNLNADLIVLDEFHRCGAEWWGAGVQRILDTHPKAYIFGTTATPIRYLDGSRDMADEIFDGVLAEDMSLSEAIVRRLLTVPVYITAFHTLDNEISELMKTLEKAGRSEHEKEKLSAEIKRAKIDWEKTAGIPEILKKYLSPEINKFIVFCKDQNHLDKMEIEVQKWFQKARIYKLREVYRVLSADPKSDRSLKAFETDKSQDTAHILFSIDMLNEGLHISDVGAVILLRPTESPIVFYQQIGRCIQIDSEHSPIIFDLVNNFRSIRANDFLRDLSDAKDREKMKRNDVGLDEYAPLMNIIDETRRFNELFEEIAGRLQPWRIYYENLLKFRKIYSNRWPANREEFPVSNKLGLWCQNQRSLYKDRKLPKERLVLLEDIGFSWDPLEELWQNQYLNLQEFRKKYPSRWPNKRSEVFHEKQLGFWCTNQRKAFHKKVLTKERTKLLNKIRFSWDPFEDTWGNQYRHLMDFRKEFPNQWPLSSEEFPLGNRLGRWCNAQREAFLNGKIPTERITILNKVGFVWKIFDDNWHIQYSYLKEYRKNNPTKWPGKKEEFPLGNKLASWCADQRKHYLKGKLPKERIKLLNDLGFIWDMKENAWRTSYSMLKEYRKSNPNSWPQSKGPSTTLLGQWCQSQRYLYRKDRLSKKRLSLLEQIGFVWKPHDEEWEKMFSYLIQYVKSHPGKWPSQKEEYPLGNKLGSWCSNQRQNCRKKVLPKERIDLLNKISFPWDIKEAAWQKQYLHLKDFRSIFPNRWPKDREEFPKGNRLGLWYRRQMKNSQEGKLSKKRFELLNAIELFK